MTITSHTTKPFYLNGRALHLSILHGTDFNCELERQAREHGSANWINLVEQLPQDEGDAIRLFQEVAEAHIGERWAIRPDVSLLAEDRVPTDQDARDRYFTAILRMNLEVHICENGPFFASKVNDHYFLLGIALIEAEIASADNTGRAPHIANCAVELKKLKRGPSYNNLVELQSKIRPVSPRASALLDQVIEAGPDHADEALSLIENGFYLIERSPAPIHSNKAA